LQVGAYVKFSMQQLCNPSETFITQIRFTQTAQNVFIVLLFILQRVYSVCVLSPGIGA